MEQIEIWRADASAEQHQSRLCGPGKGQLLPSPTPNGLSHRFTSGLGNWPLHIRLRSALEGALFSPPTSFWELFLGLNKESVSFELQGEDEL